MATATILYEFTSERGHVAVVRLDPPMTGNDWGTPYEHQFVVSSAVDLPDMSEFFAEYDTCETYLFPADPDAVNAGSKNMGRLVADWGELPGSIKGVKDHDAALADAGYQVVRPVVA